jgi:Rha family phage regulatory protein
MLFLNTNANTSVMTMTSREIAELTEKRHDNVMRDIRAMLEVLEKAPLSFEDTYINEQNGQTYSMFRLPYDETICLLTGYEVKARMKVIKRCNEANLVYLIVLGGTCKTVIEEYRLGNLDNLRDNLTPQQIAAVQDIQKVNTALLEIGMNYEDRKAHLQKVFSRKWSKVLIEEHIRLEA